jgi:hypothetical protein
MRKNMFRHDFRVKIEYSKFIFSFSNNTEYNCIFDFKFECHLNEKNLRWIISPKSARTLALCGDHSNYTFEQAGYNTAGRDLTIALLCRRKLFSQLSPDQFLYSGVSFKYSNVGLVEFMTKKKLGWWICRFYF